MLVDEKTHVLDKACISATRKKRGPHFSAGFHNTNIQIWSYQGDMKSDGANPFENRVLQITFNVIRYAVFLGLYVGFAAVCVGVFPKRNV